MESAQKPLQHKMIGNKIQLGQDILEDALHNASGEVTNKIYCSSGRRKTATDNPVPASTWQEIEQSADQDWRRILGALRHYKPGRAIPPWSAPIEIWSLSLDGP
eukprot:998268-Heterocapsa_arctica.AAC.1